MKVNLISKLLLSAIIGSGIAYAEMSVNITKGGLSVTSTLYGKVIAKVVDPNGNVLVNTTYEGSSFNWQAGGENGAYSYEVRVIGAQEETNTKNKSDSEESVDFTGGIVEIADGSIVIVSDEEKGA